MYTIKALTPVMKIDIDGKDWYKQGMVITDERGNTEAGSVYSSAEEYFDFNLMDVISIEEIKFNKGGSVTFRGVNKAVEEEIKPMVKIDSFAYRLFMERVINGLSIADLSEKSGVSEKIIDLIEKGTYKPSDYYKNKLCKALNKKLGRK